MRALLTKFLVLMLMALFATSCSIQKRTVLPGFHIERMHKASAQAELKPSPRPIVKEMPSVQVRRLDQTVIQAALPVEEYLHAPPSVHMTALHPIQPHAVDADLAEPELQEPQPWDEAYGQQKFFGRLPFSHPMNNAYLGMT